jgi:5'-nucleotidase
MSIRPWMNALALLSLVGVAPALAQIAAGPGPAAGTETLADEKAPEGTPTFWLHVLHNNDGETRFFPLASGPGAGFAGVARFKTLVDDLKAFAPTYPAGPEAKGVVMISSGDNFLAGPAFNASLQRGVPYYDSVAMGLIGYDAIAPGNHDFDFGPDIFANFVTGFNGTPPFVVANASFVNEPNVQALVNAGRVKKSHVVTVQGRQIGVVGAITPLLPSISSPRNTILLDLATSIQAEIDALTAQGVRIIILSSHLQTLQEELALIPLLRDVDIAIAGGGSELLATPPVNLIPGETATNTYPQWRTNATGQNVPIITTNGDYKYVGRLIAGFNDQGVVVAVDGLSNPVRVAPESQPDGVLPDPTMQTQVVAPVQASIDALASNVIGITEVPLDGTRTNVRTRETNLGNMAADSFLWTATVLAPGFGTPVPDVAFQNGGGVRNTAVINAGNFTELNTFDTLPFANFVSIVPNVPRSQFKEILENAVSRVAAVDGRFAQISGFRMVWDANGVAQIVTNAGVVTTPGTRVREVVLNDGRVIVRNGQVVPGPGLNIATIDFLVTGGDQYPFRGAAFTRLGVTYQRALFNYVVNYLRGSITAQDYPASGEGRIIRRN